jgi:hypothetical protein
VFILRELVAKFADVFIAGGLAPSREGSEAGERMGELKELRGANMEYHTMLVNNMFT